MKTILIVDDEFGIADTLTDILTDEGYRVVKAPDGQEGLAKALSEKPDLALVDVMMPVLDGAQMIRQLRQHPEHGATKVVLMSAAPRALSLLGGTDDLQLAGFLRKPFAIGELMEIVERLVGPGTPPAAR
jgi:CheY-like chemotaxis protein